MLIGSWGPVVFDVSGVGVLTFSEITQDTSGRWTLHEIINSAPVAEFLGPGQDEIEMKIILTKMLGINPEENYELLRQEVRGGKNYPLILGGEPLSGNIWYVEAVNGVSKRFAAGTGDVLLMELTVLFKEYN